MRRLRTGAIATLALTGCFIRDIRQANAIKTQARMDQLASIMTPMFVTVDGARVCPDRNLSATCEGGLDVGKNEYVDAMADGPDMYKVMVIHTGGVLNGYVSAVTLGELPELDALRRTIDGLAQVDSGDAVIGADELIYEHLLAHPSAFEGRELRMFPATSQLNNLRIDAQTMSFTLNVPSTATRGSNSPVRFEFHNAAWANEFRDSKKKFMCGPNYCDKLAIVATLTGRHHESIRPGGIVVRMPVFEITLLADRFGTYEAESTG